VGAKYSGDLATRSIVVTLPAQAVWLLHGPCITFALIDERRGVTKNNSVVARPERFISVLCEMRPSPAACAAHFTRD